ncbi:MAG: type II toxin-antitoxin system RelB/DinJ family antitoxin [bacterium]|nr:type II toxin-antitoxin system RelB/DinJ family antitoxin [bacterium]
MDKTTLISAKIDADFKHKAEQIFRELGLTPTQAITLFYKQVDLQHSLPFVPNEVTRKALEDARKRRNLKSFDSLESLFEDLEN